jgi:aminoglycoside 6'-N-acetyltransferase
MAPEPAVRLEGERVTLRPLAAGDAPGLRAMRRRPEVAGWWGPLEPDFPEGDDPDATRLAILEGDALVGMIQWGEEPEPDYRHAWIDIFLDPAAHGRGLAAEAIDLLVGHLAGAHGHHRMTIDPATDNHAAIRAYEKAGFRFVGVMEASWRDYATGEWRDTHFMERIVRR